MIRTRPAHWISGLIAVALLAGSATAHKLREKGLAVTVGDSPLTVTPARDWNRLGGNIGKHVETWTLDGDQLNNLTFYGGVGPGEPLVRERSRKKDPLPKFTAATLIAEVPELLEGTYRTYKDVGLFQLNAIEPGTFLGANGIAFRYEYTDPDGLTRWGEAKAAIIGGKLYMITFDAPRLYYFERSVRDFHAILESARLGGAG